VAGQSFPLQRRRLARARQTHVWSKRHLTRILRAKLFGLEGFGSARTAAGAEHALWGVQEGSGNVQGGKGTVPGSEQEEEAEPEPGCDEAQGRQQEATREDQRYAEGDKELFEKLYRALGLSGQGSDAENVRGKEYPEGEEGPGEEHVEGCRFRGKAGQGLQGAEHVEQVPAVLCVGSAEAAGPGGQGEVLPGREGPEQVPMMPLMESVQDAGPGRPGEVAQREEKEDIGQEDKDGEEEHGKEGVGGDVPSKCDQPVSALRAPTCGIPPLLDLASGAPKTALWHPSASGAAQATALPSELSPGGSSPVMPGTLSSSSSSRSMLPSPGPHFPFAPSPSAPYPSSAFPSRSSSAFPSRSSSAFPSRSSSGTSAGPTPGSFAPSPALAPSSSARFRHHESAARSEQAIRALVRAIVAVEAIDGAVSGLPLRERLRKLIGGLETTADGKHSLQSEHGYDEEEEDLFLRFRALLLIPKALDAQNVPAQECWDTEGGPGEVRMEGNQVRSKEGASDRAGQGLQGAVHLEQVHAVLCVGSAEAAGPGGLGEGVQGKEEKEGGKEDSDGEREHEAGVEEEGLGRGALSPGGSSPVMPGTLASSFSFRSTLPPPSPPFPDAPSPL